MAVRTKKGTITGNGAAQNISIGFVPDLVIMLNATDGDMIGIHMLNMTGSVDIDGVAGPLTDAGGITAYVGSDSAAKGFSIDAGQSESGKTFHYFAIAGD